MDCFYAAVEIKFRPDLKGRPVAVGGIVGGRGVLTTANYEARRFGVKSAMTSRQAMRLCPDLILVRPDFSKYKSESQKVRQILERYAQSIEPLSLDEAYVDVTDSPHENGSATLLAKRIRAEIQNELQLTASAGVAPNKFLAKIASDLNKPDGLTVIRPNEVESFIVTLPVSKIWGVGRVTANKMGALGIRTCGDLQRYSISELIRLFGEFGPQLYDYSRGIDNRTVKTDRDRKSLSVEQTFSRDISSSAELRLELKELYRDFTERFERYRLAMQEKAGAAERLAIRSVVVKAKFKDFKQRIRERRPIRGLEAAPPDLREFNELLEEVMAGETRSVRLLGLGVRLGRDSVVRSGSQLQLNL